MVSGVSNAAVNLQNLYSKIDKNADKQVSLEEFQAGAPDQTDSIKNTTEIQEIFAEADVNEDGVLSEEEFVNGAPSGPPPGGPPPGGPLGGGNITQLSEDDDDEDVIQELLNALNEAAENIDSSSASDEISELFSFFDEDGSGAVSEEELTSGIEQLRSQMMNALISNQSEKNESVYL